MKMESGKSYLDKLEDIKKLLNSEYSETVANAIEIIVNQLTRINELENEVGSMQLFIDQKDGEKAAVERDLDKYKSTTYYQKPILSFSNPKYEIDTRLSYGKLPNK